jgi:integrase
VKLTWYQATRHSFVSRSLKAGVPLDEVSVAVGHSTPVVTKRHYAHFVRKTFNPVLRQGITAGR